MSERLTDRSWIEGKATRKLMRALDAAGIDFRFVGGAVRDGLLGRPVSDVDLATPALPDAVLHALDKARIKAFPSGIKHGTVTAVITHRCFEITTLRRDVETDGRHAVVAFTDDWHEDAARRDFTMNALYADRNGVITDYFSGEADARAGRIRFIGDPNQRIAEDALRILRFFRFHAWYGDGELDTDGLAAVARLSTMIDRLSRERIRIEIFKTLAAPDPTSVWSSMVQAGVLAHVAPAATGVGCLERMVALERMLRIKPQPLRRLAALTGRLPQSAVAALKDQLRLANGEERYLGFVGDEAERIALVAQRRFGQATYKALSPWVRDAAMLAHLVSGEPDVPTLTAFSTFIVEWNEPRFPLTGDDLKAAGIPSGPDMGRVLADIERWWVDSDFTPDRDACLARLAAIRA